MRRRLLIPAGFVALGAVALGCANEAPAVVDGGEHAKTVALISVDRSDPAAPDAPGSASAIARFVSVPEFTDPSRLLVTAGATLELPAPGSCQVADGQDDVESAAPAQVPIEFVEAGEVTLAASGVTTPLVPHAFPAVGTFASGVLYTTRDRESSALPSAVPYLLSVTGSSSIGAVRAVVDAPAAPASVQVGRLDLTELDGIRTSRAIDVSWERGESSDVVYVELVAYDGSPSVVCSFADQAGFGTVPSGTFTGTGGGRLALHRLRTRHLGAPNAATGEIRFDFQVGASVEFSR
jgi:hypothetical protein